MGRTDKINSNKSKLKTGRQTLPQIKQRDGIGLLPRSTTIQPSSGRNDNGSKKTYSWHGNNLADLSTIYLDR